MQKPALALKDEFDEFIVYVSKKNCSDGHRKKILGYAKRISIYTHFFTFKDILNIKEKLITDGFYKAIRIICNFFEEKYTDDDNVLKELNKIRKIIKKPKDNPDIYTPSDNQLKENLALLRTLNEELYRFYLALMFSGVRIREMGYYLNSKKDFKITESDRHYKILLNYSRNTKNVFYIYLPKWFKLPSKISIRYLSKFMVDHKQILRTKYLRNWFYSKCLDLGIPSSIADFFQGRVPVTIGDRHYLDKERMADRLYAEKLEPYFREFMTVESNKLK